MRHLLTLCAWIFCCATDVHAQPTITSCSPLTGKPGDAVTITGTNFNTSAADNAVFFGATRATVIAATATSLTVSVPIGATYAPITVLNTGTTLAAVSLQHFTPIYSPAKNNVTTSDFSSKVDFAAGSYPYSIATADFDGDGKVDLAVANSAGSGSVSIFRNTATSGIMNSSSFAAKADFSTGTSSLSVAVGDLDGDGKVDMAVCNYNTVSIFRNTSTGSNITFAPKVDLNTGNYSSSVAIGDLDMDGKLDVVVASYNDYVVSIFRNMAVSGNINVNSFSTRVDVTTGINPSSVAIADLDKDNKPDLVVVNSFDHNVSIFKNVGSVGSITVSSFEARIDFATDSNPRQVVIGDIDNDGWDDLVIANYVSTKISILKNTSTIGAINSSSFGPRLDIVTGSNPSSVAIGDLNGDGKIDIAATNRSNANLTVLRNTSSPGSISAASFAAKFDLTTGPFPMFVVIADFDGDHKPELAVANYNSLGTISILRNADITIWDGSQWSYGTPSSSMDAGINSVVAPPSFTAKSLSIASGVALSTTTATSVTLYGNLINQGNGVLGAGSLIVASNCTLSGNPISFNGTLAVNSGATLTTAGRLTLASNATNTAKVAYSEGTISGNVTVERYIPQKTKFSASNYKSVFVASSVAANINAAGWQRNVHITGGTPLGSLPTGNCATVPAAAINNGFDATQTGNPSLFNYNDNLISGGKWIGIPTTNQNLVPGTGYRLVVRGPRTLGCDLINGSSQTNVQAVTLSATGTLAQGNQSLAAITGGSYQLTGNPYASPIDFAALATAQSANIANSYWTYNPANAAGVYSVYNGSTITNASGFTNPSIITSGQAFFVLRLGGNVAPISNFYTESLKSATAQTGLFRTSNTAGNNQYGWASLLRLGLFQTSVSDSTRQGELIVRFSQSNPAVSKSQAGSLDAEQMSDNAVNFSSRKQVASNLAIQTRPALAAHENDTVHLSLTAPQGQYQLAFTEAVQMNGLDVLLRDKHLGTTTPLVLNTPVAISVSSNPASQGANRFELIFRSSATLASKFTSVKASRHAALARNEVRFTAQEDGGTNEYQLEASTNGGQSFEAVSGVTTPGSKQAGQFSYQLNDERALTATQTVHYRIKASGNQTSYSQVVKVDVTGGAELMVKAYPNPVTNVLKIQLTGATGQVDIRLLDAQGRVVLSQRQTVNGQQTISLATKQLASGKYLLQATGKGGETLATQSVVKE